MSKTTTSPSFFGGSFFELSADERMVLDVVPSTTTTPLTTIQRLQFGLRRKTKTPSKSTVTVSVLPPPDEDPWCCESDETPPSSLPVRKRTNPSKLERLLDEHDAKRDTLSEELMEVKYNTFMTPEQTKTMMDEILIDIDRMDMSRKTIISSPLSYIEHGARPRPFITLSSPSASFIAHLVKRDSSPFYHAVHRDLCNQKDTLNIPALCATRDAAIASHATLVTELTPDLNRLTYAVSKDGVIRRRQVIVDQVMRAYTEATALISRTKFESYHQFGARMRERQERIDVASLAKDIAIRERNTAQRIPHPTDEHVPQFQAELETVMLSLSTSERRVTECTTAVSDAEDISASIDRHISMCLALLDTKPTEMGWTKPVHKVLFRVMSPSILADFPEFADQIELITYSSSDSASDSASASASSSSSAPAQAAEKCYCPFSCPCSSSSALAPAQGGAGSGSSSSSSSSASASASASSSASSSASASAIASAYGEARSSKVTINFVDFPKLGAKKSV